MTTPTEPSSETTPASVKRHIPVTIGLLVVVSLAYLVSTYPNFQELNPAVADWGGLIPEFVLKHGQWWRVITANLLHADLHHFLNNAFGLLVFGQLLEPIIGSRRLLFLIVLSGLASMLLSLLLLHAATIGASGIDYGFIGCYIGLMLTVQSRQGYKAFFSQLWSAMVFVVVFILWNLLEIQHINLWGHLGGFFTGCLFAVLLVTCYRRPTQVDTRA